jgi:regulatory protein
LEFALIRLARRAHSGGELVSKMERAGYTTSEIEDTITELRRRRYLDDLSFALTFAQGGRNHKQWGPKRIAHGLRRKGVSEQYIQRAVAEAFPEGETEAVAEVFARFRRTERGRGTKLQRKARAYRHLYAKGFSPDSIRRAIESIDKYR